jgi:phosphomannomutase
VRVSELFGRLPPRFTYTITLKGTPPVKVRNLLNGLKTGEDFDPQKIEGWFSELKLGRIERIDPKGGPQMFYKDGFSIFLRPSGNEPATRIYVEASSEEKAEEIAEKVAGVVSKSIAMMVIDYGAPNR